jgi:hypothetical protein
MKRWALLLALAAVVAAVSTGAGRLTAPATASAAASTPSPIKFLTGPNSGAPLDIAKAYLLAHRDDLRGTNVDVEHLRVSDQYKDADTNTTYIYFQQTANNVNISRAIINLAIAKDGSIITVGDRSVNQPAPAPVAPQTSAAEATATAVADAGRRGDRQGRAPVRARGRRQPEARVGRAGDDRRRRLAGDAGRRAHRRDPRRHRLRRRRERAVDAQRLRAPVREPERRAAHRGLVAGGRAGVTVRLERHGRPYRAGVHDHAWEQRVRVHGREQRQPAGSWLLARRRDRR